MPLTINYQSKIESTEINLSFWWRWIFVTFGGFLASLCWIEIGERSDIGIVEGIIGGIAIAFPQSLLLKQYISQSRWWVLASLLSWGLIGMSNLGVIGWVVPKTSHLFLRLFYGIINGAQIGLWLGIAQWFVLKREVSDARRWILASILSWSVGLGIGWTIGGVLRQLTHLFIGDVLGLAVTWILVAGMTGFAMIRLLQEIEERDEF